MNLVPMLDVLLVVIIFLVTTTTYARFSELQINLPEAAGEAVAEPPAQITVSVSRQGHYQVDQAVLGEVEVAALVRALQTAAGTRQDLMVVISADALASHQAVVRVMDAARQAGLPRVTFVTQTAAGS